MWKNTTSADTVRLFGRTLLTAFVLSTVSVLIESVAGVAGRTRLIDLTGVFIERPFWLVLFGVWAVWVVCRLFSLSCSSAIERVLALSPICLVIPFVNAAVAWLGLESTVPAFVNVFEAPVSLLTFGWLPRVLASPGLLVFLLVAACVLAVQAWSAKLSPKRILGSIILWLLGAIIFLLLPSVVSWAIVSTDASPLNAGPNVLARAWVALSQEGYWWRSILDRFPGVLEGEAEAPVRFLQLACAWLAMLLGAVVLFFRHTAFAARKILAWSKPIRMVSFLSAAFFGLFIGRVFGGALFVRAIDGLAFLLFCVTLFAVWGVSIWRNDLQDVGADTAAGQEDRPLVGRVIDAKQFTWLGKTLLFIFGVSGWLLGWPVILPLVGFLLLQEGLVSPHTRWKERWFGGFLLALSFVCVAGSGIFFVLRTAAVPILSPSIWLMMGVFYGIHALPKAFRWSPKLLGWLAAHIRVSPRLFIPIALALSYLFVPLISGWTILWWIALPCAVVALLPLLGSGRWDDRKIVGWQTAFLIISFLLLSVRPSP